MADFTTWSALLTAVRNALSNRDLSVQTYRTPDGTTLTFRTFQELKDIEAWAATRADAESATSGRPTRRVYVRPQGGNW